MGAIVDHGRDNRETETVITIKLERPTPSRSLPLHLPRDEVVHEPATGTCAFPSCGGALRRLSAVADGTLSDGGLSTFSLFKVLLNTT